MRIQMLYSVTVPEPVPDSCPLTQKHYPAGEGVGPLDVSETEGAWLVDAGYAVAVD